MLLFSSFCQRNFQGIYCRGYQCTSCITLYAASVRWKKHWQGLLAHPMLSTFLFLWYVFLLHWDLIVERTTKLNQNNYAIMCMPRFPGTTYQKFYSVKVYCPNILFTFNLSQSIAKNRNKYIACLFRVLSHIAKFGLVNVVSPSWIENMELKND